jgi:hypothetical protein
MNFIIVILKEENHSFKDSMVSIGKVFGNEHHLHGHIMLLIIVFAALIVLFVYTPLNDMLSDLIKMDDLQKASFWMLGSTAFSSLVILVYFYTIAF